MALAATGWASITFFFSIATFLFFLELFFWKNLPRFFLFLLLTLLAALRFLLADPALSPQSVLQYRQNTPLSGVLLTGYVSKTPRFFPYQKSSEGTLRFPFQTQSIQVDGSSKPCRGTLSIRLSGVSSAQQIQAGDALKLKGTLRTNSFPGSLPLELVVSSDHNWEKVEIRNLHLWQNIVQKIEHQASAVLSRGLDAYPTQTAIYHALLLGQRDCIPPKIHQIFKATGTLHIFAISGLHVGLFAMFLAILANALGVPRNLWGVVLIPLLLGYVFLTGMKPSAFRAFLMAALYLVAPLFHRKPDLPTAIAAASLILLWLQPHMLLAPGFILSFVVVGFIILFFSALPAGFLKKGTGYGAWIRNYLFSLLLSSSAALVASIPLVALFFGTFAPYALLANLLVVSLLFPIVLSGWLALLIPPLAGLFNFSALFFIDLLLRITSGIAQWPHALLQVAPPPPISLLFWYASWVVLLVHARSKTGKIAAGLTILFAAIWMILPSVLATHS
jgi:ComEC/Rec2-related protein